MSNYIMVDIDGPLLPGKMHLYAQNQKISPKNLNTEMPMFDNFAIQCFNLWAKYGNAKIVFSTNWALNMSEPTKRLPYIMEQNGLVFNYHEDMLTPKKFTSERGSEIWWWLLDNAKDGDTFIAVDDDTSCSYIEDYIKPREQDKFYPDDVVKPKVTGEWIEVDFNNGLTWENFIQGCKVLNIDIADINEGEFGIKRLTDEEKKLREDALDLMIRCMV